MGITNNQKPASMTRPQGILLFGANGCGKTTLGRALAQALSYKHMDIEDYHFLPSDIPYTAARPREECLALMRADMYAHRSFVLSAVTGDFGDEIPQFYELAVWLTAPTELRMQRVAHREQERHGARIRKGGDMFAQHAKFMEFAATRSLTDIETWAETLRCPAFRIDGAMDLQAKTEKIIRHYNLIREARPL